jgi:hypothetical protein
MKARFDTLTDADWKRGLAAARARRRPAEVRARVFSGPACPVCGRPGLHRDLTGGTEVTHGSGAGERCWWPAGSIRHPAACGHVTTEKEAA